MCSTNVWDRNNASTIGPQYKNRAFLKNSVTYAHSKPYSDWIFKVSQHFRFAQQWLAFRFSGMWHSITRLSVSQHFTVTQCLHLRRPFWWHSDTSQKIWNLSHHCNKQTNKHNTWLMGDMFGILSPIRCHEGNGTTCITTFLAQLTESHLRINIQHYAVFKMMVMLFISINLFHAEYFLTHRLTITCWNEQTQQSICQRITMHVYLQFITDSTDRIRHTSRKWNLQPETSSAKQCNMVC